MVGVPGRSKACHTCKKRKLGCDQLRPACRQCTRSKLRCGGYDAATIFVNSVQPSSSEPDGHGSFTPQAYSSAIQPAYYAGGTGQWQSSIATITSPLLNKSLEATAATSKYLFQYWNCLLPNNGQPFTPRSSDYSTTAWIEIVTELSWRYESVRLGLLFNALALVGQRTGQTSVMVEAWRIYSKGLHALARSLSSAEEHGVSRTNHDDESLMASALFAAFELLQVAEGRQSWLHGMTWLRHSLGQSAILLARGPEYYKYGHAHRLFKDARLHLIYPDIHHRKRSLFCSPQWKDVPWSKYSKSPRDRLIDVLLDIPGLLEDWDRFTVNGVAHAQCESLREQLLTRCRLCQSQLQNWSTHSGADTVSFAENLKSGVKYSEDGSSPTSEDFALAHLALIYYATCTLLFDIMQQVSDDIPDYCTDPRQCCRDILFMVSFFQHPAMGAMLINFVAFPVGVVVTFLARHKGQDDLVCGEIRLSLQRVFRSKHGGKQLKAFLETWPWQSRAERQLITNRQSFTKGC